MISKIKQFLLASGVAVGVILTAYLKGKSDQEASVKSKNYDTLKKGAEIDKEVRDLPLSSIDSNLNRWMRD